MERPKQDNANSCAERRHLYSCWLIIETSRDYLNASIQLQELMFISIMLRQSILVLLIVAAVFQPTETLAKKRCLYGVCSYTGDPHLTPYSTSYGGPQDQYLCQTPGWEVLSSNAKLSIYVFIGAAPYWILDVSHASSSKMMFSFNVLVRTDLSWSITVHRDRQ